MSNNNATTVDIPMGGGSGTGAAATHQTSITHGDHVDTIESVDMVFREQRKLSFTYGGIFFAVTLAIPALSVALPAWYATPIWGGFTLNYLFVSVLYYLFLWGMAWTYSKQADKLDDRLHAMADDIASKGGAQ